MRLRLWAPSLAGLFVEAALALAELYARQPAASTQVASEPVSIEASDRDALLADWLNELVYRTEASGHVYGSARLDALTDRSLSGFVGQAQAPLPVTSIKAASMHGLHVLQTREGFTATVILDV